MKKIIYAVLIFTDLAIIAAAIFIANQSSRRVSDAQRKMLAAHAQQEKAVHEALAAHAQHEKAVRELTAMIQRLEQSSATLENQFAELKKQIQTPTLLPKQVVPAPASTGVKPKVFPAGTPIENIPPGSAFEFKGRMYHLTPLAQNQQISRSEVK